MAEKNRLMPETGPRVSVFRRIYPTGKTVFAFRIDSELEINSGITGEHSVLSDMISILVSWVSTLGRRGLPPEVIYLIKNPGLLLAGLGINGIKVEGLSRKEFQTVHDALFKVMNWHLGDLASRSSQDNKKRKRR